MYSPCHVFSTSRALRKLLVQMVPVLMVVASCRESRPAENLLFGGERNQARSQSTCDVEFIKNANPVCGTFDGNVLVTGASLLSSGQNLYKENITGTSNKISCPYGQPCGEKTLSVSEQDCTEHTLALEGFEVADEIGQSAFAVSGHHGRVWGSCDSESKSKTCQPDPGYSGWVELVSYTAFHALTFQAPLTYPYQSNGCPFGDNFQPNQTRRGVTPTICRGTYYGEMEAEFPVASGRFVRCAYENLSTGEIFRDQTGTQAAIESSFVRNCLTIYADDPDAAGTCLHIDRTCKTKTWTDRHCSDLVESCQSEGWSLAGCYSALESQEVVDLCKSFPFLPDCETSYEKSGADCADLQDGVCIRLNGELSNFTFIPDGPVFPTITHEGDRATCPTDNTGGSCVKASLSTGESECDGTYMEFAAKAGRKFAEKFRVSATVAYKNTHKICDGTASTLECEAVPGWSVIPQKRLFKRKFRIEFTAPLAYEWRDSSCPYYGLTAEPIGDGADWDQENNWLCSGNARFTEEGILPVSWDSIEPAPGSTPDGVFQPDKPWFVCDYTRLAPFAFESWCTQTETFSGDPNACKTLIASCEKTGRGLAENGACYSLVENCDKSLFISATPIDRNYCLAVASTTKDDLCDPAKGLMAGMYDPRFCGTDNSGLRVWCREDTRYEAGECESIISDCHLNSLDFEDGGSCQRWIEACHDQEYSESDCRLQMANENHCVSEPRFCEDWSPPSTVPTTPERCDAMLDGVCVHFEGKVNLQPTGTASGPIFDRPVAKSVSALCPSDSDPLKCPATSHESYTTTCFSHSIGVSADAVIGFPKPNEPKSKPTTGKLSWKPSYSGTWTTCRSESETSDQGEVCRARPGEQAVVVGALRMQSHELAFDKSTLVRFAGSPSECRSILEGGYWSRNKGTCLARREGTVWEDLPVEWVDTCYGEEVRGQLGLEQTMPNSSPASEDCDLWVDDVCVELVSDIAELGLTATDNVGPINYEVLRESIPSPCEAEDTNGDGVIDSEDETGACAEIDINWEEEAICDAFTTFWKGAFALQNESETVRGRVNANYQFSFETCSGNRLGGNCLPVPGHSTSIQHVALWRETEYAFESAEVKYPAVSGNCPLFEVFEQEGEICRAHAAGTIWKPEPLEFSSVPGLENGHGVICEHEPLLSEPPNRDAVDPGTFPVSGSINRGVAELDPATTIFGTDRCDLKTPNVCASLVSAPNWAPTGQVRGPITSSVLYESDPLQCPEGDLPCGTIAHTITNEDCDSFEVTAGVEIEIKFKFASFRFEAGSGYARTKCDFQSTTLTCTDIAPGDRAKVVVQVLQQEQLFRAENFQVRYPADGNNECKFLNARRVAEYATDRPNDTKYHCSARVSLNKWEIIPLHPMNGLGASGSCQTLSLAPRDSPAGEELPEEVCDASAYDEEVCEDFREKCSNKGWDDETCREFINLCAQNDNASCEQLMDLPWVEICDDRLSIGGDQGPQFSPCLEACDALEVCISDRSGCVFAPDIVNGKIVPCSLDEQERDDTIWNLVEREITDFCHLVEYTEERWDAETCIDFLTDAFETEGPTGWRPYKDIVRQQAQYCRVEETWTDQCPEPPAPDFNPPEVTYDQCLHEYRNLLGGPADGPQDHPVCLLVNDPEWAGCHSEFVLFESDVHQAHEDFCEDFDGYLARIRAECDSEIKRCGVCDDGWDCMAQTCRNWHGPKTAEWNRPCVDDAFCEDEVARCTGTHAGVCRDAYHCVHTSCQSPYLGSLTESGWDRVCKATCELEKATCRERHGACNKAYQCLGTECQDYLGTIPEWDVACESLGE